MSSLHDRNAEENQLKHLIDEALNIPMNAISYYMNHKLASIYPQKAVLEVKNDYAFNVEAFAKAELCTILPGVLTHNQIHTSWNGWSNQLYQNMVNGTIEVIWQANRLNLVLMSWQEGSCRVKHYWILADEEEVAKNFFTAVAEWNSQIRSEILVFEHGYWSKEPDLFESIKNADFDNLILAGTLKSEIQSDIINFFNRSDLYQKYKLPHKRGLLFIGFPGNGKTHTVKSVVNLMEKPCLYVRNFNSSSYMGTPEENIQHVFKRARESAPCILVLEDLDALINQQNRSFFLNEIDGFSSNQGILILATSNYPERIDPALLDRPGRFDRKFYFDLPALKERADYIRMWNGDDLDSSMRLSEEAITRIAESTDGFSFTYLREVCLFSRMLWMETITPGTMEQHMMSQVTALRKQMGSSANGNAQLKSKSDKKKFSKSELAD